MRLLVNLTRLLYDLKGLIMYYVSYKVLLSFILSFAQLIPTRQYSHRRTIFKCCCVLVLFEGAFLSGFYHSCVVAVFILVFGLKNDKIVFDFGFVVTSADFSSLFFDDDIFSLSRRTFLAAEGRSQNSSIRFVLFLTA
jgi:hypothetical protein